MRSIKLRVPKRPGEKRTKEGLRVVCAVCFGGLGSTACLTQRQKMRGMLRSICWLRYQCCGIMSRVADQPKHCGHDSRPPCLCFAVCLVPPF